MVRVAAYDYMPESIRNRPDVSYTLLGSDVRNFVAAPRTLHIRPIREPSSRPRGLRESIRRYHEAVRAGTQPSDIPSNHLMWIEQTITALRSLTNKGTPWELKFSEILNALRTYTQRWNPPPSSNELTVLLTEFLNRTDMFGKTVIYTPNWQSALW